MIREKKAYAIDFYRYQELKQLLEDGEYDFMESHKDEPKLEVVPPRSNEEMSYIKMLEQLPKSKGVYIKPLWPSIEEIKQAELENPGYTASAGYGCIRLSPKFD